MRNPTSLSRMGELLKETIGSMLNSDNIFLISAHAHNINDIVAG